MRAILLGGMLACLAVCITAGVLGASVLALAGALAGMGLFGLAVERSQPSRWPAAELDYDRDRSRDDRQADGHNSKPTT